MSCLPGRCGSLHDDPGFGGGAEETCRGKGRTVHSGLFIIAVLQSYIKSGALHLKAPPRLSCVHIVQCPQFLIPLPPGLSGQRWLLYVWPALLPDTAAGTVFSGRKSRYHCPSAGQSEGTPGCVPSVVGNWTPVWRQFQMHKLKTQHF